ncbi:MAG: hypothetical protein K2W96_19300, partial [Gemmataceae bacterium]|nr:hypothetical protein [Gemmataceae bacterium]
MMRHALVPTADFRVFDHPADARHYIATRENVSITYPTRMNIHWPFDGFTVVHEDGVKYIVNEDHKVRVNPPEPMVVKADGLAAGKGVFVCHSTEEAMEAVERIMTREEFGREAGRQVLIEKKLEGEEVSILGLVAGRSVILLPPCQDHKRRDDGDRGPNTGGMGAYCPAPIGKDEVLDIAAEQVFVPVVHAMRRRRTPFRGILYAGLMVANAGPRVLEFNCRLGDPEAQPLLMRLKTDLLDVVEAVVDDRLDELPPLEWDER